MGVNGALFVGPIGLDTEGPSGVLPHFVLLLRDLAAQLIVGLLPRLFGAVAHLHSGFAWAADGPRLGVAGADRQQQQSQEHEALDGPPFC